MLLTRYITMNFVRPIIQDRPTLLTIYRDSLTSRDNIQVSLTIVTSRNLSLEGYVCRVSYNLSCIFIRVVMYTLRDSIIDVRSIPCARNRDLVPIYEIDRCIMYLYHA